VAEKKISIVLPAYNEAIRIEKCIQEVEKAASSFSSSYELIVAEDGSTDGTDDIVAELSQSNPRLRLLHSPVRLGKGKAIKRALGSAEGEIIVFMDVDLATSLDYLQQIASLARTCQGIAIGSRHVKGAKVRRRLARTVSSLIYNLFVRILFLDGVHDHQCGFKAMSHVVADALLGKIKSDGFFFDTEMILWCRKRGFTIVEVGVEWSENQKKSESAVRLFPDSLELGLDLLKFRLTGDP
jgi:glycosyltransferase involved in cell wall biosynthesis